MKQPDQFSSEAVLLEACVLTNAISNYNKEHLQQGKWPEQWDFLDKLKTGWQLYHASHWHFNDDVKPIGIQHDYQGVILINSEKKQIILAHRGLQLESVANLVSGLVIGTKRCPEIAQSAIALCDIALQYAQQQNYQLIHTGFSMGGYLAQITGAYANHHFSGNGLVICFEAVGATPAIESCGFKDNRDNTINYVTAPNVVNTCNVHYGYVRQIEEFKGHNMYLKSHMKSKFVAATQTLNLDDIDEKTAELFEELLWTTVVYHRSEILFRAMNNADCFQFIPIHGWPVSKIDLETVEVNKVQNKVATEGSYGMILNNIINNSTVIRSLAGYEGCNALRYNLSTPEIVYLTENQPEVFCQAAHTVPANNPYAKSVDNDQNPESKYDPCVLM